MILHGILYNHSRLNNLHQIPRRYYTLIATISEAINNYEEELIRSYGTSQKKGNVL